MATARLFQIIIMQSTVLQDLAESQDHFGLDCWLGADDGKLQFSS